MIEYLSPGTLEKIYKDLNKKRLDLLQDTKEIGDLISQEIGQLTSLMLEIGDHYEVITSRSLWEKISKDSE